MLLKVLKGARDTGKPDMEEMETAFNIGDKFKMEYDWCDKIQCINGYRPNWHKDVAEFKVVDMVCNMLVYPSEVWLRLGSDDELFKKRCGSEEFDAPEKQVIERVRA